MSDFQPASVTPPPVATASASTCAFCHRPIVGPHYQLGLRQVCGNCASQLNALRERNAFDARAWLKGTALGLLAALGSGLVWALVAKATNYELGILAVGIGWIVSVALRAGSGGRRGRAMQATAIALAIIGVLVGKILTIAMILGDKHPLPQAIVMALLVPVVAPQALFSLFDIIWIAIAVMTPYRMFKPLALDLRGPFDSGGQPGQALQFDRVEPAAPTPPAGGAG